MVIPGRAVWMCSKPYAAMTCVFNVKQNLKNYPLLLHDSLSKENISSSVLTQLFTKPSLLTTIPKPVVGFLGQCTAV
jgi:hypothetical protein